MVAIEAFRAQVGLGKKTAPLSPQDFRRDAVLAMGQSRDSRHTRDRFRLSFSPITVKEISAMTNQQIQLVQQSFELITPVLESATASFYDRLFQLDPSLRGMFRSPQEEQARKL